MISVAGDAPPFPAISDDEIRESVDTGQLRLMGERGIDLTLFSPRASAMGHQVPDARANAAWARVSNDLVARVVHRYPEHFAGVCQLPQTVGVEPRDLVPELRRCVQELGFVGPGFHATGPHYLNAGTTAFMQLMQGDLFKDSPELRSVIPHGGGAVPYHWGRFRGLAGMLDRPAIENALMGNVFFDTCVYHQAGIDLLFEGAVRGIDPQTGHYFDDTRRYIEKLDLAPQERAQVYEGNARRVYPRLNRP